MENAQHLAGALALELGHPVKWHVGHNAEMAILDCQGRQSYVGLEDLAHLDTMAWQMRRSLYRRIKRDLEPPT